jgi:hypothetical protein
MPHFIEEFSGDLKDLAAEISKLADLAELETASASEYSPGPVADEEFLARLVFAPIHFDDDGQPNAAAFGDATTFGCSVQRGESAADLERTVHARGFAKEAADRERGKERVYRGFLSAVCSDIRALIDESTSSRLAIVCDTALVDNPSHADVIGIGNTRSGRQNVRVRLFGVFQSQWCASGQI